MTSILFQTKVNSKISEMDDSLKIALGPCVFVSVSHHNEHGDKDTKNQGSWVVSLRKPLFLIPCARGTFLTGVQQPSVKSIYLLPIAPHISYKIQPKANS